MKRHSRSDVLGGAYVFPGGKVDAADDELDALAHLDQPLSRLHASLNERDINERTAGGLYVAALREAFGAPITCNDWHIGGSHKYSGQRPQTCAIGAKNSEHKAWRAFDLRAKDMDALRGLVCARGRELGITRMEASFYTPTWVHIDFKPTNCGKLYIFTP